MNDKLLVMWLAGMLVVELVAVFVAFFYVFTRNDSSLHIVQKVGFASLVFGLVVQVIRSIHFLQHGHYPIDHYFPMWITKDIGACILIYYYSFIHGKGAKQ